MSLTREQRAELHYQDRGQWLRLRVRHCTTQVFGIASLSNPQHYYLSDGTSCTCPDFRFHGLADVRMGQAGLHHPCSHVMAVRRVLELPAVDLKNVAPEHWKIQAAIAESQRTE